MLEGEARLRRVPGLERGLDLLEAIGERGRRRRGPRGRRDERAVLRAPPVDDDRGDGDDGERERERAAAREEAAEAIERAQRRGDAEAAGVDAQLGAGFGERLGVVERLQERGRRREPVLARLLERLQHDLLERDGHVDRSGWPRAGAAARARGASR